MQLSVVILNYNVRYFLELCLKSVYAAIDNIDAEIIVVDNHSSDDSCEMIKMLFPNVILIENKENFGFSKGNNIGVEQAKGDYIAILNPDTVVAENTFDILLKFASSIPNIGIVGCKLIDGKGQFLPESKRNVPTPKIALQKIFGNSKPYYAHQVDENEVGKVSILVGAFMLLKREVYNAINGFDEDYFMYGEDIDFSYRVEKVGFQNYYNPSTVIIHFKGESTLRDKLYAKRFNEAMQIFFKKHFEPNVLFNSLIWFGIKAIILINKQPIIKSDHVENYMFKGNIMNESLKGILGKPIHFYSETKTITDNQQIIIDNHSHSFKTIIDMMIKASKTTDVTFKILPKDSRFIIGSNSSKSRGEVIKF